MAEIKLLDSQPPVASKAAEPENWYIEPFTKRTGCRVPGQCGGDCDCGCPYKAMTEVEQLPLIADLAALFPNEWLAFIIAPPEDGEYEPIHGKLIAHSHHPDDVYDAVNTVLWNQHVYVFFNGDFAAMQASYGDDWYQETRHVTKRAYSGPEQPTTSRATSASASDGPSDDPVDLIYRTIDHLYGVPNVNQAIRRLRLARIKAASKADPTLVSILDIALDKLETPTPLIDDVIWYLEETLVDLETS